MEVKFKFAVGDKVFIDNGKIAGTVDSMIIARRGRLMAEVCYFDANNVKRNEWVDESQVCSSTKEE